MSKLTYQESFFELDLKKWNVFLEEHPDLIPGYKEIEVDEPYWAGVMADYDAVKWAEWRKQEEEENEATRQHVAALLAEHGEDTLRALLKAICAELKPGDFASMDLWEHDLENAPVESILSSYGSALRLEIEILPNLVYSVELGESYGTAGGGNIWEIQRVGDEFLPAEFAGTWRC